jgi:hypothetical protein
MTNHVIDICQPIPDGGHMFTVSEHRLATEPTTSLIVAT